MSRYFAEGMGAFMLVFAGCGAIVSNDVSGGAVTHVGVSLTFGLVVMSAIYAVGNISGASMNPARSLAPAIVSGELSHLLDLSCGPGPGSASGIPHLPPGPGRRVLSGGDWTRRVGATGILIKIDS